MLVICTRSGDCEPHCTPLTNVPADFEEAVADLMVLVRPINRPNILFIYVDDINSVVIPDYVNICFQNVYKYNDAPVSQNRGFESRL